jgi:uncharacterized membrane protein YfcA
VVDYFILFLVLAFLSEIIGTISGFGSSILFVPVATLFYDFHTVLGITAIFHVFSNCSKLLLFRKGISIYLLLRIGLPATIFVGVGAYLSAIIPVKSLKIIMPIVLIGVSLVLLVKKSSLQKTAMNMFLGGSISGFFAGIIGSGGAIRGLVLMAFDLSKDAFIATSAAIDLGVDITRGVIYIWNGFVKSDVFILLPFFIGVSFFGSYVGKLILKYVSEHYFKYLVLAVIICSAIIELYGLL